MHEDLCGEPRSPEAEAGRDRFGWLARVVLLLLLVLVGVWTVQRTTRYLAIDQFGYLTFARDLAAGRLLHEWSLQPALEKFLPKDTSIDVYSQTYVLKGEALYSRYAPGFPILLGLTRVLFGPDAQFLVNPAAMMALLGCLFWVGRQALGSAWLGLGVALLCALLPNYLLLWSTSPLRDVPAHLFALTGLGCLLPAVRLPRVWRELLAGLLLGYAVTTRIDAVLYLVPAGSLALLQRPAFGRRLVAGVAGFLVGVAPLLVYNYAATGNPIRPTQAMEVEGVISRAPSAPGWAGTIASLPSLGAVAFAQPPPRAATGPGGLPAATRAPVPAPTPQFVQGGGLRLRHLSRTLPANLVLLRETFGDLASVLGLIGAVAALRLPVLFLLAVPYVVVSVLFFSLWTLPGPRYLAGVMLLFSLLVVHGARTVATLPASASDRGLRRGGLAVLVLVLLGLLALVERTDWATPSALPYVTVALAGGAGLAAVLGVFTGRRSADGAAGVVIAVALTGILAWRSTATLGVHASFQAAQVERARSVVESALEAPAVVITTTRIGRPAENLNYYTSADALYLEEMTRWRMQPRFALARLLRVGYSVYLLLPPEYAKIWLANPNISTWYESEVVKAIPPGRAAEYFVASPYHRGIPLWLVRLRLRERSRAVAPTVSPPGGSAGSR